MEKSTEVTLTSGQQKPLQQGSTRPVINEQSMVWRLGKLKLFLGQFYQKELGDAEMLLCKEYVDLLDVFTNHEINDGIRHYQINGPRTKAKRLSKPAGGDLHQWLMDIRVKRDNLKYATKKVDRSQNMIEDTTPIALKPIDPARKESAERIIKEVAEAAKPQGKPTK